jgi:hypothetical protein
MAAVDTGYHELGRVFARQLLSLLLGEDCGSNTLFQEDIGEHDSNQLVAFKDEHVLHDGLTDKPRGGCIKFSAFYRQNDRAHSFP